MRFSRRNMMTGAGAAAIARSLEVPSGAAPARQWPILEGSDTPKIALALGDGDGTLPPVSQPSSPTSAGRRGAGYGGYLAPKPAPAGANPGAPQGYERILQLGVTHLIGVGIGGGGGPWTEESVRRAVELAKNNGCVAYNAMLDAPESVRHGKPNRANDLEQYIASVEAAGKGGLPVVEYNFYAHRAIEGYYETVGRARAGYTGFDYELELLIDPDTRQEEIASMLSGRIVTAEARAAAASLIAGGSA